MSTQKESPNVSVNVDQDVYVPITPQQRQKWPNMIMIFIGMWVSIYSVGVGFNIGQSMSVQPAILSCILGYLIAGIIAALVGDIGRKHGLSSYVIAKCPLGWAGQLILALLQFIVVGFASVGLQADAVGRTITATFASLQPWQCIVSAVVCGLMMFSAIKGVKYMSIISWITMPFFFIISIIAVCITIGNSGGLATVLSLTNDAPTITFMEAVFLNAGSWAGFVMLMPDVSRFLESRKVCFTITPVAFLVGSIPPIIGVILGATTGVELSQVFVTLGIGVIGMISIAGIGWTTNDNNAYTAGLALSTVIYPWKKITRKQATIIVAVFGVIGAATGLGQAGFFTALSSFLGSFNMSLCGVLIAHYYIVSRTGYIQTKGLAGVLSWLSISLLTYFGILPVPVITATISAFILYLILYYGVEKKLFGEKVEDSIKPKLFRPASD